MNSEINPHAFPALPVRRRETLEIFDTSLKLYRRYFWVLLGWSALIAVMSLVPILSSFVFFTMPLLYGAVSCCVAGAVRGQKVSFPQCWSFTKPRYGALLGVVFLSYLVFFAAIVVFYIAAALLGFLGYWALSSAPQPVQTVAIIVGVLLGLVGFSTLGVVAFGWMNMVPIVACLEDDKRGSAALGRAFELLKGQWRRVFGISLILGFAVLAVFGIVVGIYSLVAGFASLRELFDPSGNAIYGLLGTFGAFWALFLLIWNPAQTLIISVLYLDLRVRREALDIEWTAYASAPAPDPMRAMEAIPATYPNTFSAPAPAPAEFDFLRPDAVPDTSNTVVPSAAPNPLPSAPLREMTEDVATSPASFAAGSSAAPVAPFEPQNPLPTDNFSGAAAQNADTDATSSLESGELQNPENEARRV